MRERRRRRGRARRRRRTRGARPAHRRRDGLGGRRSVAAAARRAARAARARARPLRALGRWTWRGRVAIVTGGAAGAGGRSCSGWPTRARPSSSPTSMTPRARRRWPRSRARRRGELRAHRRAGRRRRRAHGRLRRGAPRRRRHPRQQRRRLGADGELPVRLAAAVGLDARPQPARADARHPARARADAPPRRRRRGQRRLDRRGRARALRVARVRRGQGRPHPLHDVHGLRARADRRTRQLRRPGLDRRPSAPTASWPR